MGCGDLKLHPWKYDTNRVGYNGDCSSEKSMRGTRANVPIILGTVDWVWNLIYIHHQDER